MKSVYNVLGKPISQYFRKDITRTFTTAISSQTVKEQWGVEDTVSISSRESYKPQVFSYKPSLIQQKMRQVGINTYSRPYVRQYSTMTKGEEVDHIVPQIQYGGDFEELVTKSTIFVDKSLFIQEILTNPSKAILITMPRRWGKSVNMDMLKRFLEIKVDKDSNLVKDRSDDINHKIFFGNNKVLKPLKISGEFLKIKDNEGNITEYNPKDYQGQYPVIYIDLKDCDGSNYTEIESKVKGKLVELYKKHGYLSKSDKIIDEGITIKDQYLKYINKVEAGDISAIKSSLKNLSDLLYKHFDKKVWILVDEYDSPLNYAFIKFGRNEFEGNKFKENGDFQKAISFFKSIMSPALKGNTNLEKGVLTGVLSSAQSSMLSGLNNVKHYNLMNNKFAGYYGFNKEEMENLINHFYNNEDSFQSESVKELCNGYRYGNIDGIHNTWSTVDYLNNKNEKNISEVWTKSGGFDLVEDVIFKNTNDVQSSLNKLISGQSLSIEIKPDIEYEDLMLGKTDTFISTLLWTGYLTPTDQNNEVRIPNESVKKSIKEQVIKWIERYIPKYEIVETFSYLENNDITNFDKKLKSNFSKVSFHDLNSEKDYHNIMSGIMMTLPSNYVFISNIEAGAGRLDNAVYDRSKKIGYIFEYKYINKKENANLEKIGKEALEQIEKNRYNQYLKNTFDTKDENIKKIAIVFHGKVPYVYDKSRVSL